MPRINRRDLIASLGASATLLAGRAHASCDTWRDSIAGLPTKSYQCLVGEGQILTTTFMRISDVMFDSAGHATLPGEMGDYQGLVSGHRLIGSPALETFEALFENYAFAFEPQNLSLDYDLRSPGASGGHELYDVAHGSRWRTLGYWDDTIRRGEHLFPLPDELRRAMRQGTHTHGFLRFATRSDFSNLDAKIQEYFDLWGSYRKPEGFNPRFANLSMLADIDAGSVPGFVPLKFSTFVLEECSGTYWGGASFLPPALYVDVATCRNDGARPVEIQDLFGAVDGTSQIRPYDPSTPPQEVRFGLVPVTLAPGESLLMVQRLLLRAENVWLGEDEEEIVPKRAVFGPTHLPKGVIVNGRPTAFDGRSHNAVILASFANCCCCPFLESWCPRAGEWIEHGKVLQACEGPAKAGEETRRFGELRTRFRLSEREHEETFLTGAHLTLTLRDSTEQILVHPDAECQFSLGDICELTFDVPDELASRVTAAALTLTGHYEKFTQARFEARAKALSA